MMLREKYGYRTAKQIELLNMAKDTLVTLIDPGFKVIDRFF